MTVKELKQILDKMPEDARVVAGFTNINHHVNEVDNVGPSRAMSFAFGSKRDVVVLDLCEEVFNADEDLDKVEWFFAF